jgi:hypothetical protein
MVSTGGPTVIKNTRSVHGVVNFFAIHHDLSLSGRHRPNNDYFMLFAAAFDACFAFREGFSIGESKSPVMSWSALA